MCVLLFIYIFIKAINGSGGHAFSIRASDKVSLITAKILNKIAYTSLKSAKYLQRKQKENVKMSSWLHNVTTLR